MITLPELQELIVYVIGSGVLVGILISFLIAFFKK